MSKTEVATVKYVSFAIWKPLTYS